MPNQAAAGAVFTTSTASITFGADSSGAAIATMPAISTTGAQAGLANPGDDAVIKAVDLSGNNCTVFDAIGNVIDFVTYGDMHTYVAGADGRWQVTHGRIVVGHPSTPPANTTTPVAWLEASSQNGNITGRVPLYQ